MLLYGQVLNALMVFPVYLFTTLLVNDRRAGVIAALIAGLITPMPAYYTSWGRYTQLGALAILPAAAALLAALRELQRNLAHALVERDPVASPAAAPGSRPALES